ncbi:hypothetical protein SAMN02745823_03772 [Sporobacter termitidis DSM 10068]|uniref:Uncharacterized protein n=1 Tax=Sporobacter termitidis DSM 10068 TaxID=1123282 RepID=A0A1M5ZHQ7_9FIRM|nr:DUF6173 family protein [Sporobacter termitidis]SHI23845.1 hypothetical protein SAMN02745823_03772 [Sporobacter termitidis DSM 10068]
MDNDFLSNLIREMDSLETLAIENPVNTVARSHMADKQQGIILETIKAFEEDLDDEHEVALKLACFGQTVILNVTGIGFHNPDILRFYGFVNGSKATLMQHVSQLNFLMMSVEKVDPTVPPHRIGFGLPTED